jgi:hypothetical protein
MRRRKIKSPLCNKKKMDHVAVCAAAAAPSLNVSPQLVLATLPHNIDEQGLGFGQGSTDGVLNTYPRGGFHRRSLPPPSRSARRRFNMRSYRGTNNNNCLGLTLTNACHYDPEPYYDEAIQYQNAVLDKGDVSGDVSRSDSRLLWYLAGGILFLVLLMKKKLF